MSNKFHVGLNGAAECNASVRECPLGGENHYDSMAKADAAFNARMAAEHGSTTSLSKAPDRLHETWSKLPSGDKVAVLGHSQAQLSRVDRARFAQVATALGRARRQSSSNSGTASQSDRLQETWGKIPAVDKLAILGHSHAQLPKAERARFAQIMTAIGRARRQSS